MKKVVKLTNNVKTEASRFNEADKVVIRDIMVELFQQERANTTELFKQERAYTDKRFDEQDKKNDDMVKTILSTVEELDKTAQDRFDAAIEHMDNNLKLYKEVNTDVYTKLRSTNIRVDSLDLRVSELERA